MARYAVINQDSNLVVNMIKWDGVSQWAPPSGCFVVNVDELYSGIGFTYNPDDQSFTAPAPAPEEPPVEGGE